MQKAKEPRAGLINVRAMPISVTVKQVMEPVVAIDANQTVKQALDKLIERRIWSMLVERQGLPVGVITEHDILRRCVAKGYSVGEKKVEDIMSAPLITIEPTKRAGEALEMMFEKRVGRLFVVENGKVVGRVTQTGLTSNLLDVMMALRDLAATP